MNKNKNLLIVDDNKTNVELLRETLLPLDFNLISFSDPLEALEESKKYEFELALLDVVMPDLDGFQFAQKFRETHENTPIIFVSAHGTNENKLKGYNLGSFAYIEKPYNVSILRAHISSILKVKQLQNKLFAEKEKLDNIFAFSSDEIILTDKDFNINSKNHRIFIGGETEHSNFLKILEKYNKEEMVEIINEFVGSDKKHISLGMTVDDVALNTKISKIMDAEEDLTGYLVVIRDITEEIRSINQKEQFIATLTHDLKTPIRAESRALELLMNGTFGELNKEQTTIVAEIYNSSRFMARMTDNLLTRYKIDRGEVVLQKEENSIKQTIQKCADNLKYFLEAKNQMLKINADDNDYKFFYDELEISRVINNLLTNASEYSPDNSDITIQIEVSGKNIEISITDSGAGIPSCEITTIFDEHVSGAKRFKKVGSGLGLFITKRIIESHDGTIAVKSEQDKGTSFTMTLPFCTSAVPEASSSK